MSLLRIRWTTFRLMLAVAVLAIASHLVTERIHDRARERRERCLQIAEIHASSAAEYRRNARADPVMLRIAAWHRFLAAEFERAARVPDLPVPKTAPCPPPEWEPPAAEGLARDPERPRR